MEADQSWGTLVLVAPLVTRDASGATFFVPEARWPYQSETVLSGPYFVAPREWPKVGAETVLP